MKRAWVAAVFLFASASAVGVRAGDTANMRGSLFDFTNAMLAACPGTAGPYAGTGTDNGESAMLAGAQGVAPMSRFLGGAACAGAAPSKSEGLVIGLDSVVLVGSRNTIGGVDCNGDVNTGCTSNFEPATGAAYDTTIVGDDGIPYTFDGWRDVLRVLLAGFHHDVVGTGPAQWVKRKCDSPVRIALADNYGSFFENNCAATAGEADVDSTFSPACTQIRHIFRPDDYASATDTLVAVLGLPSVVVPETVVGGVVQHTGASPFCNAVRPAFVYAMPQPTTLQGGDATWDPTSADALNNGREIAVYRAPMQDNDPIRRLCAGTGGGTAPAEDVCSHSGDLGFVLSVSNVEEAPPRTNADRYNANPCGRANLAIVAPPDVYDAATQTKLTCATGLLCPNGDVCNPAGGCYAPADLSGNPRCLATRLTTPALTVSLLAVPRANPRLPALSDGRGFNQHLYEGDGSYQVVAASRSIAVTGAYHRIHAAHSLAPPTDAGQPPICQRADPTDQIGCLVRASPCSLAFAGRQVLDTSAELGTVKIDKQSPELACIQSRFAYPLSTKIYFNAMAGFADLNGQELALARCMTDRAQPSSDPPAPAGLLSTSIASAGFIAIPSSINGGEPYCEDFDEAVLCASSGADAAVANANACASPTLKFDAFPTFATVCGDGRVDAFEDCDDGAGNGLSPAACSSACRFNH
jgi:hypothetical protein